MKIKNIDLRVEKDELIVSAEVITPNLNWTNVQLAPQVYFVFPADGILDIDVSGDPPPGPANDSVFTYFLETKIPYTTNVFGVRLRRAGEILATSRLVVKSKPSIGPDKITVKGGTFDGDKVFLDVEYVGNPGKPHRFQLDWDGLLLKSFPPQIDVKLSHNIDGDHSQSNQVEELQFDFSGALGVHPAISFVHVYSGVDKISIPLSGE